MTKSNNSTIETLLVADTGPLQIKPLLYALRSSGYFLNKQLITEILELANE
ncbi:MAG: hypothetical protein NVV73_04090 [Cellvibrionaceae bacterium]|nr:hypothetical protein [Cellvibrionaceae bacterium]